LTVELTADWDGLHREMPDQPAADLKYFHRRCAAQLPRPKSFRAHEQCRMRHLAHALA
jgi:hypothetical protein